MKYIIKYFLIENRYQYHKKYYMEVSVIKDDIKKRNVKIIKVTTVTAEDC